MPKGKSGTVTIGEGREKRSVPAILSRDGKTAAAGFGRGATLFVLRVEGAGAPDVLRELAAGTRLD